MFRKFNVNIVKNLAVTSRFMSTASEVHISSQKGFAGQGVAEQYHAARPTYTDEAIEAVVLPIFQAYHDSPAATSSADVSPASTAVQLGGPSQPLRILDIGAGTGIFTFRLAEFLYERAAEAIEYEIHAVEPSDDMRAQFNRELERLQKDPATADCYSYVKPAQPGTAAALPYPRGYFSGAVAAQALHWFADPQTLDAMAVRLAANGVFCALWNNYSAEGWAMRMHEKVVLPLYTSTNTPHQSTGAWQRALADTAAFSTPLAHARVPGVTSRLTAAQVWQRFESISVLRALPPAEKEKAREELMRALSETEPLRGASGEVMLGADGTPLYELKYVTDIHWVSRKHQLC